MIDIRNEDWTAMPNRTTDDPLPTMEVVRAIVDHGAKLDVPLTRPLTVRSGMDFGDNTLGEGATPMMRAARAGDHEVIRVLLAKGANPALTTKNGVNALMLAAGIGYRDKNTRGSERDALETVKVMIAAGLDVKQTDTRGENALHGAPCAARTPSCSSWSIRAWTSTRPASRGTRRSTSRWGRPSSGSCRCRRKAPSRY